MATNEKFSLALWVKDRLSRPTAVSPIKPAAANGRFNKSILDRFNYNLDVPLKSYLDFTCPLSILSAHPDYLACFYSYNIQLFFPQELLDKGYSGGRKFILRPALNNWQWKKLGLLQIEWETKHLDLPPDGERLLSDCYNWLEEGHFLEMRINEYYLPCRSEFFNRRHNLHMNVVVGGDKDKGVFFVAGIDKEYEVSTVTEADLVKAFYQIPSHTRWVNPTGLEYHRTIWRWRVDPRSVGRSIDLKLVQEQVDDYRESRSSRERRVVAEFDHLAYPEVAGAWGLAIYDSWAKYLDRVEKRKEKLDLRASRTLWEHKECMVMRLHYLKRMGLNVTPALIDGFGKVEAAAKQFRLFAFGYNLERGKDKLISLRRTLASLRSMEEPLYAELSALLGLELHRCEKQASDDSMCVDGIMVTETTREHARWSV